VRTVLEKQQSTSNQNGFFDATIFEYEKQLRIQEDRTPVRLTAVIYYYRIFGIM
jgi:hypothetical protein